MKKIKLNGPEFAAIVTAIDLLIERNEYSIKNPPLPSNVDKVEIEKRMDHLKKMIRHCKCAKNKIIRIFDSQWD